MDTISNKKSKGPFIKDVPSKPGLFDPLPLPFPPYDVIVTLKVALLCPLWAEPPLLPLTWDVLSGCPQTLYHLE